MTYSWRNRSSDADPSWFFGFGFDLTAKHRIWIQLQLFLVKYTTNYVTNMFNFRPSVDILPLVCIALRSLFLLQQMYLSESVPYLLNYWIWNPNRIRIRIRNEKFLILIRQKKLGSCRIRMSNTEHNNKFFFFFNFRKSHWKFMFFDLNYLPIRRKDLVKFFCFI